VYGYWCIGHRVSGVIKRQRSHFDFRAFESRMSGFAGGPDLLSGSGGRSPRMSFKILAGPRPGPRRSTSPKFQREPQKPRRPPVPSAPTTHPRHSIDRHHDAAPRRPPTPSSTSPAAFQLPPTSTPVGAQLLEPHPTPNPPTKMAHHASPPRMIEAHYPAASSAHQAVASRKATPPRRHLLRISLLSPAASRWCFCRTHVI